MPRTRIILLLLCLLTFTSVCHAQTYIINEFDYNPVDTSFSGGPGPGNFVTSFGGLLPTAGNEFYASGNGNDNFTFNNQVIEKNLGAVIGNTAYFVQLNVAWYNDGQDGGVNLIDFNDLYIGSAQGHMEWRSTPDPVNQDQWYTWNGIFTPDAIDIGQPWHFYADYNLNPRRDIALDLPQMGFATAVPEPATLLLFTGGLVGAFIKKRHIKTSSFSYP